MIFQVSLSRLLISHLLWPLLAFTLLAGVMELSTVDLMLADKIYQLSGNAWSLREHWITAGLIHNQGRNLVAIMIAVMLMLLAASFISQALAQYKKGLFYLLVSTLTAGLTLNILKEITHVDCPWDLIRYGGNFEYAKIFAANTDSTHLGACFPSGHASGAYAWFGLVYVAREYRPQWQKPAFLAVLLLGLVFGLGQQLRGAHFLSHDLWSLSLCWFITTGFYFWFYPNSIRS